MRLRVTAHALGATRAHLLVTDEGCGRPLRIELAIQTDTARPLVCIGEVAPQIKEIRSRVESLVGELLLVVTQAAYTEGGPDTKAGGIPITVTAAAV